MRADDHPSQLLAPPMPRPRGGPHASDSSSPGESRDDDLDGASDREVDGPDSEEWERLRAPFASEAYHCQVEASARSATKGIVRFVLAPEAIQDRLDLVLGPGRYSYWFDRLRDTAKPTVFCHLQIGRATRTGVGDASDWRPATGKALSDAAAAFGIGRAGARADSVVADIDYGVHPQKEDLDQLERPPTPDMWAPEDA